MPKPKEKHKDESFEKNLTELQATVAKLEAGDLSLDESLALFQRGMELAKKCGEMLDQAELRINELVSHDNKVQVEAFEEEE